MRQIFSLLLLLYTFNSYAQYTEVINSNQPGESQGAFSVGTDVLQVEGGVHYGVDKHNLTGVKYDMKGIKYEARYGFWKEGLEIHLKGDFLDTEMSYTAGGTQVKSTFRNFESNTLGVKYLLYDPNKKRQEEGPNLYSWRKNNVFQLEDLIPAVSVYAGANLLLGSRPNIYPFYGKEKSNISPKVTLITQNNWGNTAFVMNFEFDNLTDDHKRLSAIYTLTHTFLERFSIYGEFQTISYHFYSDELARFGLTYLYNKNFQINLSGLTNFKNTPRRWAAGLGVSYRIDRHID